MTRVQTLSRSEGGFTLLEVLITVLVLSIGLLGLAALQTNGLRSNQMASLRTLATQYAYDIGDRMRANIPALTTTSQYYVIDTSATPTSSVDCDTTACTPQDTANYDLVKWRDVVSQLPGGKGQVTQSVDAGTGVVIHTITVHWNETRDPAVTGETCPPASFTDLRCFQLTI